MPGSLRQIARCIALPARLAPLFIAAGCAGSGALRTAAPPPDPAAQLAAERDSLRQRAAGSPLEPYWPYRLGALFAGVDSLTAAGEALEAALAADPLYGPALSLRAKLYYDAGDFAAGAALLSGALAAGAEARAPLVAALALHLDALGEREEAARYLAELDPDSASTAAALGYLLLRGESPFDTEPRLRAAAAAAPASAAAANNLGIGLLYAGRPEEAAAEFERALALNPRCAGAHYNLAIVELHYRFDEAAAREQFLAYRGLVPGSGEDPDELGRALAVAPGPDKLALSPRQEAEQE